MKNWLFYADDSKQYSNYELEEMLSKGISFIGVKCELRSDFMKGIQHNDISIVFDQAKKILNDIIYFYKDYDGNGPDYVLKYNDVSLRLEKEEFYKHLRKL